MEPSRITSFHPFVSSPWYCPIFTWFLFLIVIGQIYFWGGNKTRLQGLFRSLFLLSFQLFLWKDILFVVSWILPFSCPPALIKDGRFAVISAWFSLCRILSACALILGTFMMWKDVFKDHPWIIILCSGLQFHILCLWSTMFPAFVIKLDFVSSKSLCQLCLSWWVFPGGNYSRLSNLFLLLV